MPTKKKSAAKKKTAKKTSTKKKVVAKKKTAAKAARPAAKKKTAAKAGKPKAAAKKKTAAKAAKPAAKKKTAAKAGKKTAAKKKTAARRKNGGQDFKSFTPYKMKKGEEYMNDTQVAHFEKILTDWKRELMEEVDRTVHHMQDEAANFPDPNDRASQESEFTIELRTRDRERKLIKKIDEALDLLENGEYGYCEQCGVEIGIRRLEARPTATLCIDCKSLDEILEKTRA